MKNIMNNNVLFLKRGLFWVKNLKKPITAIRVVDRDGVVQDF